MRQLPGGAGGASSVARKVATGRVCPTVTPGSRGALIASEFLFVATILVIGTVVGLANVRDAVNAELTEFGNALLALSQGYTISGVSGCSATTDGSAAIDTPALLVPPTHTAPAP